MSQQDFRNLLTGALSRVTVPQQQRAARYNNRAYIHQVLNDMIQPNPVPMEELLRACQDQYMARPEPVLKRPHRPELVNSFEYSMSSLEDGPSYIQ